MFDFKLNYVNPQDLQMLPSWIKVTVVPHNHLLERVDNVVVDRELTYDLVDELYDLAQSYHHSLHNSDRQIAGFDVVMSATLHILFKEAAKRANSLLGDASYKITNGHYRLISGCLEESPNGKRALHRLPSTNYVYGRPKCLDDLPKDFFTATMVAEALAPIVEASIRAQDAKHDTTP
jgi:hypothetical protein